MNANADAEVTAIALPVISYRQAKNIIQVNLIITLSLGSMKTNRVISEPCYNEVIYNRHISFWGHGMAVLY